MWPITEPQDEQYGPVIHNKHFSKQRRKIFRTGLNLKIKWLLKHSVIEITRFDYTWNCLKDDSVNVSDNNNLRWANTLYFVIIIKLQDFGVHLGTQNQYKSRLILFCYHVQTSIPCPQRHSTGSCPQRRIMWLWVRSRTRHGSWIWNR